MITPHVRLTQLEYRLLYTLLIHRGQILPTATLIEHVWGYDGEGNMDLVRGLVRRLRAKVEENPRQPRIMCAPFRAWAICSMPNTAARRSDLVCRSQIL